MMQSDLVAYRGVTALISFFQATFWNGSFLTKDIIWLIIYISYKDTPFAYSDRILQGLDLDAKYLFAWISQTWDCDTMKNNGQNSYYQNSILSGSIVIVDSNNHFGIIDSVSEAEEL